MQVEAIYRHGRVELLRPLRLKRDNVRLVVTVSNEDVEPEEAARSVDPSVCDLSPEIVESAREMQARLDAIRCAPLPPDDEIPELGIDYDDRLEAMDLRAELREEQGRPV